MESDEKIRSAKHAESGNGQGPTRGKGGAKSLMMMRQMELADIAVSGGYRRHDWSNSEGIGRSNS